MQQCSMGFLFFLDDERDISVSISTLIKSYQFQLLHTGNTTAVYGIRAVINTLRSDDSCAIGFLGEDRKEIVVVSEPIRYGHYTIRIHCNVT